MSKKIFALAAGLVAVAGCAQLPGLMEPGNVTLTLIPQITESQYKTQADVSDLMYTRSSITKMDVILYKITTLGQEFGTEGASISNKVFLSNNPTVTFTNLHHNTKYRIKTVAYKADGSVISDDDMNSCVDVQVLTVDAVAAALKVKLKDPTFNGQGSSTVAVTDSVYIEDGTEAIN